MPETEPDPNQGVDTQDVDAAEADLDLEKNASQSDIAIPTDDSEASLGPTPNHTDGSTLPLHPPKPVLPMTAKDRRKQQNERTKAYLGRRVDVIPGHLEHGVLATRLFLGYPHVYRLELALGLLDHLTVGMTAHWLPGQTRPGLSPVIHAAFFRSRRFVIGANYRQLLYPPPVSEEEYAAAVAANKQDPEIPIPIQFQQRVHYLMGGLSFSQAWFSAAIELGWARGREFEPYPAMPVVVDQQYTDVDRIAGGVTMRFGTRRYGLTIGARYPYPSFDIGLDLRFGLFEVRQRGKWMRPG